MDTDSIYNFIDDSIIKIAEKNDEINSIFEIAQENIEDRGRQMKAVNEKIAEHNADLTGLESLFRVSLFEFSLTVCYKNS